MATKYYHEHRRGFAVDVCGLCFSTNPHDEELMRVYCRTGWHHGAPPVQVTWSAQKFVLVQIRRFPDPPLANGRYVLCNREATCKGPRCTYAHSEEEAIVWNTQLEWRRRQQAQEARMPQQTIRTAVHSVHPQQSHVYGSRSFSRKDMKMSWRERCKNPPKVEDAEAHLTQHTYQSKFYSLLYYEEEEHINLLSDKCDGEYRLTTYKRGVIPPWVRRGDQRSKYGCLLGMRGDQIMYASQASECVFIVDQGKEVCSADILSENMHGHYDELLIEFKDDEARKLEGHFNLAKTVICRAEFEVKHFYFDLLHRSLRSLTWAQISKVIPTSSHTGSHGALQALPPSPYTFLELDAESQQPALQMVVSSKSQDPVLISGAFGTGKTRLLAVATYHFIEEGKRRKVPTRVLLCCHHQATADTFIEEYFGKMIEDNDNPWNVQLARVTRARYFAKSEYPRIYSNLHGFRETFASEFASKDFVVIVTTLLTGLNLQYTVGDKFFTHILLDEAAQAREPEAIAPLSMANRDTKIVIAGDDKQVGPEILVLGKIAQANGLSKSLFTRLLEYYSKNRLPVAVLNTNHRCHKSIVSLASKLFYSQSLLPRAKPSTISGAPPIWFVCSSLEKHSKTSVTDKAEVDALIRQLTTYFKSPKEMEEVCIMATNRHQLSDIRAGLIQKQRRSFVPAQFLPTYLIQGEEFKALFMSTVESLDPSGCSFNPTKSLCCPSVFNTAITRAKSLVVAVGNPYVLMHTEMQMGSKTHCWLEYLNRCFKTKTVIAREGIDKAAIEELQQFVNAKLQESVPVQKVIEESPTRKKEQRFGNEAVTIQHLQQQLKYERDSTKEKKSEIYQLQKQLQETSVALREREQMMRELEKRELHVFKQKEKEEELQKNSLEEQQQKTKEKEEEIELLQETIRILEQKTKDKEDELQMTVNAFQEQQQKTKEKEEELQIKLVALEEQKQKKEAELQVTAHALEEQKQEIRAKEAEIALFHTQLGKAVQDLEEQKQIIAEKEKELRETTQAFEEQNQKTREKEQELQEIIQAYEEQQQKTREKEEELQIMAREKAETEQLLAQQQAQNDEWVVKREEVEMSEEEVGKGAWGEVKVAKFRGLRVAAKCLHQMILSDYNNRQFSREMTIAGKLRHPNLLLFIGATKEGEAIIITELMPTSLRKELEKGKLTQRQIITISQDVSCGLNYMHQSRPHPIIHRDISSGNVLLEPLLNGWRAKISDYGSANFLNLIKSTVGPGSIAYAAPEAPSPDFHTTKMDVFSLGVLMVEMNLREIPENSTARRAEQIKRLPHWPAMVDLIKNCISKKPTERPDAIDIMSSLDSM